MIFYNHKIEVFDNLRDIDLSVSHFIPDEDDSKRLQN